MSEVIVELGEYKGNPVISLKRSEHDKFPFTLGIRKAQLVIDAFDQIQQFVETNRA